MVGEAQPEAEPSSVCCKLPDMAEFSAIDALNEAFINETSVVMPGYAVPRGEV